MKSFFSLLLLTSVSAYAFYEPSSKVLPLRDRFKVTTMREEVVSRRAQKFMAYLSLSSQSISYGLKDTALADIAAADREARALMKESAGSKSVPGLPLGKLSAGDSDFYVPIWVADGISEDLRMEKRFFKTRTTVEAAKFVVVTVSLDLADVLLHLEKASGFVKKEKYTDALFTLSEIRKEALVSESEISDPLLTVWARLSLAEEFLKLNDFSNARYTLKQVKTEVARLEKEKILSRDSAEVKALENDISGIEDYLSNKSPTLAERGKNKVRDWKMKVKNWM